MGVVLKNMETTKLTEFAQITSPLEVDRLFYAEIFGKVFEKGFPSPLEVRRIFFMV